MAAQIVARLSSMDGETVRVTIGDLSAHGCSVRCVADWLRTGRFISVGMDEGPPLRAVVRWVRDNLAGLEFRRPMSAGRSEWHEMIGQT